MTTSTFTSSCINPESTFGSKVRSFLAELRHVLELTGQAYYYGRT